jgi:hypothetical protein
MAEKTRHIAIRSGLIALRYKGTELELDMHTGWASQKDSFKLVLRSHLGAANQANATLLEVLRV